MLLVSKLNRFFGVAQRCSLIPLFFIVMAPPPVLANDIVVSGLDAHQVIIEGEVIHSASEVKNEFVWMHHLVKYDGFLFLCITANLHENFYSYCVREGNE